MKRTMCLIGFVILLAAQMSFAGDLSRVGTVGGTQLLIPVGARSIALGGGAVSNITGAEAIYWNPAGLSAGNKSELMFNNMQYIAGIDLNYFALVYNGGNLGSFGFAIKSLEFGTIEETTAEFPDGTGRTYSPTNVVANFTYARRLTDRINAGVTFKYVYESIMQTSGASIAFDLGVQYAFNSNLRVGVVMKNVGTKMRYDGRNLETSFQIPGSTPDAETGKFRGVAITTDIPSLFSFGLTYKLNLNEQNSLSLSGAFSNLNEASDQMYGGVEYNFNNFFFLRGGYTYDIQLNSDEQLFGATFGAGLRYSLGNFDFVFDYAYRDVKDFFDANQIFTVKLGL
ncbi:MAG: hypothetical protein D6715_06685 [Calditrichaeota bacterium]|nr:MAG: hypothetical protein D6715_06685 [Calditrichota bacterium]